MQAIAHGGCADTVRESALEVNSGGKLTPGEKSLAAPGTRTRVSITLGFFSRALCHVSILAQYAPKAVTYPERILHDDLQLDAENTVLVVKRIPDLFCVQTSPHTGLLFRATFEPVAILRSGLLFV